MSVGADVCEPVQGRGQQAVPIVGNTMTSYAGLMEIKNKLLEQVFMLVYALLAFRIPSD